MLQTRFLGGLAGCGRCFHGCVMRLLFPPMMFRPNSQPNPSGSAGPTTYVGQGRLELSHVSKNFAGSSVHALQDINLTCQAGEFVVVVGPSGCGKSTLLNVAAGMIA